MNVSFKGFIECFWRNLVNLVKANLLFWLFCLPVVTIPASLAALNTVCADAALGKSSSIWETYIRTIKKGFRKSLIIGVVYAAVFLIAGVGIWFYGSLKPQFSLIIVPEGITIAVAAVSFATLPYSFVMLGETELNVAEILKNSFIMLLLEPKISAISFALCFVLVYIQTVLFMNLYAFILVIGVSLAVYADAYFAIYGLLRHVISEY